MTRALQQFNEEKTKIESRHKQQVDSLNKQVEEKDMMIREISKQNQIAEEKAEEKVKEYERIKEENDKLLKNSEEKEKAVEQINEMLVKKAEEDIKKHVEL